MAEREEELRWLRSRNSATHGTVVAAGTSSAEVYVTEATDMAAVLVEFTDRIPSDDGTLYSARAVGDVMPDGRWEGWVEFRPAVRLDGDAPLRTGRETTQPNRTDTEYWATGLTPVYLEGALRRALHPSRFNPPV